MTKYDIAANVALESLEGFEGTMKASAQKRVFGRNIFGKKTVHIDATNQGRVFGFFKVCFGTDAVYFSLTFEQLADMANHPDEPINW
jgi:hypothetical protein